MTAYERYQESRAEKLRQRRRSFPVRIAANIRRWWEWQTEPRSTTIFGRAARMLRFASLDSGQRRAATIIRDRLANDFVKAGVKDI